jgi:hypothetical protein
MSSSPPNDAAIEIGVRDLLGALDSWLGTFSILAGLSLLLFVPGCFFLSMLYLAWYTAVGGTLLVFFGITVAGMSLEEIRIRRAARQFNARFPPGSPARPLALRVLSQNEYPHKAEQRLLAQLNESRQSGATPEQAVQAALDQLGGAAPPPATPSSTPTGPQPTRPGGYYDYIPLELPPSAGEPK